MIADRQLEQEVLGLILAVPETFDDLFWLTAEDFTVETHRRVWEAMVGIAKENASPDMPMVASRLAGTVSGLELAQMMDNSSSVRVMAKRYGAQLRGITERRNLSRTCLEIAKQAADEQDAKKVLDLAEASIMAIRNGGRVESSATVREILKSLFPQLEKLHKHQGAITGCSTGFEELDYLTAGLQDGDLIIVAARPSMGKTVLAGNIAEHAAGQGRNVVFFSLEMGKEQIVTRHLSSVGKVDGQRLRNGTLQDGDWSKLTTASEEIAGLPYIIDDTPALTVMELRARARRHIKTGEKSLIVVDYLQLMRGSGKSRTEDVSEISRGLKALARELNCPVVALSQLNRSLESRSDKRPIMADIRESGAIEQDADVILFVCREAVYCECKGFKDCNKGHRRLAEVIIGKQRNGPLGVVKLEFRGEHYLFRDGEAA